MRVKQSGYTCMYAGKTFVTKFQHVADLLRIAEVIRKQSGHEQGRKLLNTALEAEKELTKKIEGSLD